MLELTHIQKSFDGVTVLKDISIQVEEGEIVSILGPSGCGKTTLLNLILGIVEADAGTICYNGEDLTRAAMEKRGFNIVFQDYALFPNLNVYQNITYGLKNKPGISSQEEVEELIHLLGLGEHLSKRVDQLSGGQKQRVALARTMVMKPRILLLDEPLSALDGVIKESIKDRIKTIAREFHLTTIIVTHDPEEALTLSDRVLIIDQGTIAQYGRPADIIQKPENDVVRTFILNQLLGNKYLIMTTITMICATAFPKVFNDAPGANEIGTFLIYIFFAVIGAPASIMSIITQAPLLLVYALIIVACNMLITLIFGKIFKFSLEEIILASNANIGGPTTAAAMAISKGWNKLVGPVLLIGTLGYVLGNYYGVLVGNLLR